LRVFVASWFFPPVTTAEGIVTFKLLKHSSFEYDVCSSKNDKWSYKNESNFTSKNINSYIIKTDSLEEWIEEAVKVFIENNEKKKYDIIMTRIFPPESHVVGLRIKKKYPDVRWIASFGDPLAINPYELKTYVADRFRNRFGRLLMKHPQKLIPLFSKITPFSGLKILANMQRLHNSVIKNADYYIFPSVDQCKYMMGRTYNKNKSKYLIIPHSFDKSMYPENINTQADNFVFTYIGHADNYRNPSGFIHALKLLKGLNPEILKKIKLKLVGNYPFWIKDMVFAFFLYDNVEFYKPVDYHNSLRYMKEADCLIHIDAFFDFIPQGSIFLASKIIDYIGTRKPILGLTTNNSTAGKLLEDYGNIVALPWDYMGIASAIVRLVNMEIKPNYFDADKYSSEKVAAIFDNCVTNNIPYIPEETTVKMER